MSKAPRETNNFGQSAPRYGQSKSGAAGAFNMSGANDGVSEEAPAMRSVALMGGSAQAPGSLMFQGAGPKLGMPSGIKAPPKGFGKPPALGIPRPSLGLPNRSESYGVKKEWSGVGPSLSWNVKGEDLDMVPEDFPLERTNRTIPDVDACVVASRISETLRSHSIEAEFDDEKAKAKCKTSDFVCFRIRLYAGGEDGLPVVVEVQRRMGSASSFMRTCRAILNAAEGKSDESEARKMPPFMKKPVGQLKCIQPVIPKFTSTADQELKFALDGVMDMLRSGEHDTNVLGLENLCNLTDPIKTSPLVSIRVSKCVALGDAKYDVREEIRLLTERDVFAPEFGQEEGPSIQEEQLRHLALSVFSNALEMCSKDGCLAFAVGEQKWFADHLIPSLLDEVKRSSKNGCNACFAASCLCSLTCSDVACHLIVSNGGKEALVAARDFGYVCNELLSSNCERCLKVLEKTV